MWALLLQLIIVFIIAWAVISVLNVLPLVPDWVKKAAAIIVGAVAAVFIVRLLFTLITMLF